VQIAGQARNHRRPPALLLLAGVDQGPDIPIQADELGIDGQHGPRLRVAYALLDVAQQCGVIGGREGNGLIAHGLISITPLSTGRSSAGVAVAKPYQMQDARNLDPRVFAKNHQTKSPCVALILSIEFNVRPYA